MKTITIIGAGAYSLALTRILSKNGVEVKLFTKFEEEKKLLEETGGNEKVLPGIKIASDVIITTDPVEAFGKTELIVVALPSNVVRIVMTELSGYLDGKILCIATKGIEAETGLLMNEVLAQCLDGENEICAISGPSHAPEIAAYHPTIVTSAGSKKSTRMLKDFFENENFKIEEISDVSGTLAMGAFKNIFAIGAGILIAQKASSDTIASFIMRSLVEMRSMCEKVGGDRRTVDRACGTGDLIASCTSPINRNRKFGITVGESTGTNYTELAQGKTVEGYKTSSGALKIIKGDEINFPIVSVIGDILHGRVDIEELLKTICR